jgi:glutamyl-tRNA synthetase
MLAASEWGFDDRGMAEDLSACPVGRLAPSPTGALHLGNARSFLLAWLQIRVKKGVLLLRIEDLDGPRIKPGAIEGTLEDLEWLGLDWDGEPLLQSERGDAYFLALEHLKAKGLVYPCVCTRSEIERAQSAPQESLDRGLPYPGTCRGRYRTAAEAKAASGREPAWRFWVEEGREVCFHDQVHGEVRLDVSKDSGDFVVAKKDGLAAYQLAVVVDDLAFGVTQVLRGDDLLASTARQLLLIEALGGRPPSYAHVPLVLGPDGRRLAKRHGDSRLAHYRKMGVPPGRILGLLAHSLGLMGDGQMVEAQELLGDFDLSRIPMSPWFFSGEL